MAQVQESKHVRVSQPAMIRRDFTYAFSSDLDDHDQPTATRIETAASSSRPATHTYTQRIWDEVVSRKTDASEAIWDAKFKKSGLALEVKDACFTVKTGRGKKRILDNVSITNRGGEMQALMGPSGAGKTTLLDFAAMELKGGEATGSVTLNGHPLTPDLFRQQAAYVDQFDTHWAFLSCREIMKYAAELYLPGDKKEQETRVNHLMTQLGLVDCADTRAGNEFFKGLSGGQKKRLTAAMAMLKSPSVLLLDEPTSGLDAASAAKTVGYLKELAESAQIIVLATIHQPSTEVFMQFDRVTFLAGGRVTYSGRTNRVADYCQDIGNPVPDMTNPADHWLKLTNNEFVGAEQVNKIVQTWRSKDIAQPTAGEFRDLPSPLRSDPLRQFGSVLRRQAVLSIRDPMVYVSRMVNFLIANLFFTFIYMNRRELTQENVVTHLNLVNWFVCLPTSLAMAVVHATHSEYTMVRKEVKNGLIRPGQHLLANFLLQIPYMILVAIFALAVPLPVAGFPASHLPHAVVVLAAALFAFECMAQMFGVACQNPLVGMAGMSGLWFSCFLFMGFSLAEDRIVWPFRLFVTILPLKWTFQSMTYAVLIGTEWSGAQLLSNPPPDNPGFFCPGKALTDWCWGVTGEQVLESIKVSYPVVMTTNIIPRNLGIVILIALAFKAVYVAVFCVKSLGIGRARPVPLSSPQDAAEPAQATTADAEP